MYVPIPNLVPGVSVNPIRGWRGRTEVDIHQLLLCERLVQLLSRLVYAVPVDGVHHEDQRRCVSLGGTLLLSIAL